MARSERNARHDDRAPAIDPYFDPSGYAPNLGYQMRDAGSYTGYSYQDGELPGRLGEVPIDHEVKAPLGGELVGRLAPSSYGNAEGPAPGSYLQGLDPYPLYGFGCEPMDVPAGACSTRERLGVPPGAMDDTSLAGVGTQMFLTTQHAMGRAPLAGGGEHLITWIRSYANAGIYDGGDVEGYGVTRGSGGGGDYGHVSAAEELGNIRRENDSGDEFAGDGWDGAPIRREDGQGDVYATSGRGERAPTSFDRRRVRDSDYDR